MGIAIRDTTRGTARVPFLLVRLQGSVRASVRDTLRVGIILIKSRAW